MNRLKYLYSSLFTKTNKKLISIVSDDWGSERIRSLAAQKELENSGLPTKDHRFNLFDSFESNKDLEGLFDVLAKHKDGQNKSPIITTAYNVANPDFDKIEQSNFELYSYKTIPQTIGFYPQSNKVLELYKQGLEANIFIPESHGREHVNTINWMKELQNPNSFSRKVFGLSYFFIPDQFLGSNHKNMEAPFNFKSPTDADIAKELIEESVALFVDLFGYHPTYFTAPALLFSKSVIPILKQNGFKLVDMPFIHLDSMTKRKSLVQQNKNIQGLQAVVRNNMFDPNINDNYEQAIDACLANIASAFKSKQPSIISNHRAAFVGSISEKNRTNGLKALNVLLGKIIKKWPDVEFVRITDLPNYYNN